MSEKQNEMVEYILSLTPEQIEKVVKKLSLLYALIPAPEEKEKEKEEAAAS